MKSQIITTLLSAAAAPLLFGAATTPVGYYTFDQAGGSHIVVPGFVKSASFSGAITSSGASTLTLPAASLVAGAYNAGASYATHYVEITSGPNAGVSVDIVSNTDTVITVDGDISGLSLVGNESITVRPHITVADYLGAGDPFISFADSVTFYEKDTGSPTTYLYISEGYWSTDFGATNDGGARPIPPGTGFVLGLVGAKSFAVVGEVKETPTVVQLSGTAPNICGPINPLEGGSTRIDDLGFENLGAFLDAITLYNPGSLTIVDTYLPDGAGNVLDGSFAPSSAELAHTSGVIVTAGAGDTTVTIQPGFTVAP